MISNSDSSFQSHPSHFPIPLTKSGEEEKKHDRQDLVSDFASEVIAGKSKIPPLNKGELKGKLRGRKQRRSSLSETSPLEGDTEKNVAKVSCTELSNRSPKELGDGSIEEDELLRGLLAEKFGTEKFELERSKMEPGVQTSLISKSVELNLEPNEVLDLESRSSHSLQSSSSLSYVDKGLDKSKVFDKVEAVKDPPPQPAPAVQAQRVISAAAQANEDMRKIKSGYKSQQIVYRLMPLSPLEEARHAIPVGDYRTNALTWFRSDIQAFEDWMASDPSKSDGMLEGDRSALEEMKNSLSEAAGYAHELEVALSMDRVSSGSAASRTITGLVEQVEERVRSLVVGESMLIPGGTQGHAVIYKLTRTADDKYSYELFNTGSWALEHYPIKGAYVWDESQVPSFKNEATQLAERYGVSVPLLKSGQTVSLKWEDCSISSLLNSGFLRDQISSVMEKPPIGMDEVLDLLFRSDIGKPVCGTPHHMQVGNSCSYNSILICAKKSLSSPVYNSLHLFLMRRAATKLNEFFRDNRLLSLAEQTLDTEQLRIQGKLTRWSERADPRADQLSQLFKRVVEHPSAPVIV